MSDAPRLAVIGCGNPNRGDDGVGPAVIACLRSRALPSHVALFDAGTDGMSVLYRARGMSGLVIVDARIPGLAPGAIYDVPGAALERAPAPSYTLHDFRWDHALYAGRRIYGDAFPSRVRVFLIEAENLAAGTTLTDQVRRAAAQVCNQIVDFARTFAIRHAA